MLPHPRFPGRTIWRAVTSEAGVGAVAMRVQAERADPALCLLGKPADHGIGRTGENPPKVIGLAPASMTSRTFSMTLRMLSLTSDVISASP